MNIKSTTILLVLTIILGAFFRFYKLDWGQGLFTHPDEYHIVISTGQLSFPDQMHPHFFSYGSVVIYLIFFTQQFLIFLFSLLNQLNPIPYTLNPFLIGRFYSALFSTLSIYVVYKISQIFLPQKFALIAAFLTAATAGLIQQAHFATPESWQIFFLLSTLLFTLYFAQTKKIINLLPLSVFFGLAVGVKVSSLFLAPVIVLAILISLFPKINKTIASLIITLSITITTLFITSPYIFFDFPAFRGNVEYETRLATGDFPVFYTRQFIDTIPIIFQFEKIYPYALGPTILITGLIGFIILLFSILKSLILNPKSHQLTSLILLAITFLSLFIPNAFLFAKWTRFLSPTFAFFSIFTAFLLFQIDKIKFPRFIFYLPALPCRLPAGKAGQAGGRQAFYFLLFTFSLLWALAFFSIYQQNDVRIKAANWIYQNIPPGTSFLVEGGNMVDLPLQGDFKKVSLDFYSLEENTETRSRIAQSLAQSDYFLVQSRRVFYNHQKLPGQFPMTANFYNKLFSKQTGFVQIKEFNSYPSLKAGNISIDFPDEEAEETWSVFDHPVIRIFQKIEPKDDEFYLKLFEK